MDGGLGGSVACGVGGGERSRDVGFCSPTPTKKIVEEDAKNSDESQRQEHFSRLRGCIVSSVSPFVLKHSNVRNHTQTKQNKISCFSWRKNRFHM